MFVSTQILVHVCDNCGHLGQYTNLSCEHVKSYIIYYGACELCKEKFEILRYQTSQCEMESCLGVGCKACYQVELSNRAAFD